MKKIGLFFGSFNPIHNGHTHIAELASQYVDEVWFVVSPHNPLKDSSTLINEQHRLNMVKLSINDNSNFKPCDIEFHLSKPSYTYKTLEELVKNSELEYYLIFGSDCVNSINTWENGDWILSKFPIIGFKRNDEDIIPNIKHLITSNSDLSSTIIRSKLKDGESLDGLVHPNVEEYLHFHKICE